MLPATQMDLIGIHYQQRRGLEGIHFDRKSPDGTAHFFPNCAIYPDKCALFCTLPTKLRKLRIYLRIGTAHNRNTKDCAILINPLCGKPLEGNLGAGECAIAQKCAKRNTTVWKTTRWVWREESGSNRELTGSTLYFPSNKTISSR